MIGCLLGGIMSCRQILQVFDQIQLAIFLLSSLVCFSVFLVKGSLIFCMILAAYDSIPSCTAIFFRICSFCLSQFQILHFSRCNFSSSMNVTNQIYIKNILFCSIDSALIQSIWNISQLRLSQTQNMCKMIQTYIPKSIIIPSKMGKCVSSMQDKGNLRNTAYYESKPLDVKVSEDNYSFLQYRNKQIKKDSGSLDSNQKEFPLATTQKSDKEPPPDNQLNTDPMDNLSLQLINACNLKAESLKDEEDILNDYNTRSKIYKLSKKLPSSKSKRLVPQQTKFNQKQVSQKQETIQATLIQQGISSTISLKHEDIDMQFSLPRCRAGPLVVPRIPYEAYTMN